MAFLKLLVLFLGFSYVVSTAAVPATRSLIKTNKEDPSVEVFLAQDAALDLKGGEELFDVEGEGFMEGRMDLAIADYKGTGANPDHDPKSPGRN